MENWMEVFYILLLKASLILNFMLFRYVKGLKQSICTQELMIKKNHELLSTVIENIDCQDDKLNERLDYLNERFDHVLVKVEHLIVTNETPKSPIKPNNWDSIKEAFKVPTRVEVHERT